MELISLGLARLRPGFKQARLWAQFLAGMFGFGLSIALMVRSHLGLGPWDAFHAGIHNLTGMTIGTASILTGLLIVAGMTVAGEPPRLGTIVNMFAIGICLDLLLPFVPPATGFAAELAYSLTAIGLAGICTGLYIGTGLGKGARDGLSMWLSGRTRVPVRRVRMMVELVVLAGGWAMGGTIGLGTVLFSLLIGPSMEQGLRLFGVVVVPAPDAVGSAADAQAA
ncbi:MAG: hypothetical protein KY464_07305 [Gemmatimonadetes bacterium]|nr:hypothetical protein [Gemmatimonadota bacterium]